MKIPRNLRAEIILHLPTNVGTMLRGPDWLKYGSILYLTNQDSLLLLTELSGHNRRDTNHTGNYIKYKIIGSAIDISAQSTKYGHRN